MTPAVTSQSIATQCNSCSHTFTVNREEIRSSPDGITQCPSCRTPIKFAFCPQCSISYSIVMKNLPPNRYATTCKRCGEQFTITIPSLTPSRNTRPPFIEKVTVPVRNRVTAERPHAPALAPAPEPAPERETGHRYERTEEHRSTGYAAEDGIPAQDAYDDGSKGRTETPDSAAKPPYGRSVDGYKESYYAQKAYRQYGLKELFSSFARHLTPQVFLVSLVTLLVSGAVFAVTGDSGRLLLGELPVQNTYAASFIRILPFLFSISIYIAGATVISRIVMDAEERYKAKTSHRLMLFLRTLGVSVAAGAPALFAINVLLVFLARIPTVGTLLFSLMFLPIYAVSLATVIMGVAGVWFLPPIFAEQYRTLFGAVPEFAGFLKKYNLRLFYIIPALFMLAFGVFAISLALHGGALFLLKTVSHALAGKPVTEALSGIPVFFTRIAEFSAMGENRDLLYYLSGGTFSSATGGTLVGLVLSAISIGLYTFALSVTAIASVRVYTLLEKDIDTGDRAKRQLFSVLLLAYVCLALLKYLML